MSEHFTIDPNLKQYDTDGIKKLIPHRDPMLLIDRIVNIVDAKSVVGLKQVTGAEDFFRGHFPGHPVFPGVLIVEAMAQSAGALVVHTLGERAHGKIVYFMSIESAKFRKPVTPGCELRLHCDVVQGRGNVWKFSGVTMVENTKVAEATYTAMIMDNKDH